MVKAGKLEVCGPKARVQTVGVEEIEAAQRSINSCSLKLSGEGGWEIVFIIASCDRSTACIGGRTRSVAEPRVSAATGLQQLHAGYRQPLRRSGEFELHGQRHFDHGRYSSQQPA